MKILLDTHAFIWFISGNSQLNKYAHQTISDLSNERFLSIARLWEMAIKASIGTLKLELPFTKIVSEHIVGNAIEILHIATEHLDLLKSAHFHHKDPFDRLIIFQCMNEKIPIVGKDEVLNGYGV